MWQNLIPNIVIYMRERKFSTKNFIEENMPIVKINYNLCNANLLIKRMEFLLGGDNSSLNYGSKLVFPLINMDGKYSSVNEDLQLRFMYFIFENYFGGGVLSQILTVQNVLS